MSFPFGRYLPLLAQRPAKDTGQFWKSLLLFLKQHVTLIAGAPFTIQALPLVAT